jgi:hypothetical protein
VRFDSVLAFGDSTTAGCELIEGSENWDETKKLSFPNTLANKLNVPCYNYAWPGGSNDRSLRLLPEVLLDHPNSLVLFTYTSFDRTEFFTLDKRFPQDDTGYVGVGQCWSMLDTIPEHKHLNKTFLSEFFVIPDNHNRYKIYNSMMIVDLICKQYAKDYKHIFLYDSLFLPPDYQEKTYMSLDKEKIFKFDFANDDISWKRNNQGYGSLSHWAKLSNLSFCPKGHIGKDAHDKFAQELYNSL